MGTILLAAVLMVGVAALVDKLRPRRPARRAPRTDGPPDQPVSFGHEMKWLAVGSDAPAQVMDALGLSEVESIGWPEGMAAAHARELVFVTPPIEGWVLVVGRSLPELAPLVERLSRALATEVQAFEPHAWRRAVEGASVRAFGWSGGAFLDQGEPTPAEEGIDEPDEADVMRVAAHWSVDPSTLDAYARVGLGWRARLA
jgi:hypothetical protein